MNWSEIAKQNTNTSPVEKKSNMSNNIEKQEKQEIEDYETLYNLKYNNMIDDIYHDIVELIDKRCVNILDKRRNDSYSDFYNLIYNNTKMDIPYIESDNENDEEEMNIF